METSTIIILLLISVISVILILSVVHISSKVDEMASYLERITRAAERKPKDK